MNLVLKISKRVFKRFPAAASGHLLQDLKLEYIKKLINESLMQVSCIVLDLYTYSSVYTVDVWFHSSYQLDTQTTSPTNYSKL